MDNPATDNPATSTLRYRTRRMCYFSSVKLNQKAVELLSKTLPLTRSELNFARFYDTSEEDDGEEKKGEKPVRILGDWHVQQSQERGEGLQFQLD